MNIGYLIFLLQRTSFSPPLTNKQSFLTPAYITNFIVTFYPYRYANPRWYQPIVPYLGNDLKHSDIVSLKKKRIIFMDQLCSIDGNLLNSWDEIKNEPQHKYKGSTPGWFKRLEDYGILSNNNRRLLNPLNQQPIMRFTFTAPTIHSSPTYYRPPNEWTITWDSKNNVELYGKTIEQHNDPFSVSLNTPCALRTTFNSR